MKIIISIVLFLSAVIPTKAQHKKTSLRNIDSLVDAIYSQNSTNVTSVQPLMNADMEKNYKIRIHNGSKKQIVALELLLEFPVYVQGTTVIKDQCFLPLKIKILVRPKSNKTYILNQPDKNLNCHNTPSASITTIVYADGTFISQSRISEILDE